MPLSYVYTRECLFGTHIRRYPYIARYHLNILNASQNTRSTLHDRRLLDSLVVECWLRVREVPGSIPSQGQPPR